MKARGLIGVWVLGVSFTLILLWALGLGAPLSAESTSIITVDETADDANPNGLCSLREAISAANSDTAVDSCTAGSGDDIILLPAGTYQLSIPNDDENGEDYNATGDLDILSVITLTGAGPEQTIIDAGGIDRVLDVDDIANSVYISDLTLRNGKAIYNGGGIEIEADDTTLVNVVISDCVAANYGGALREASPVWC